MSITLEKNALTKYKVPVVGLANRFDGDKFMLKLAFTCQMLNNEFGGEQQLCINRMNSELPDHFTAIFDSGEKCVNCSFDYMNRDNITEEQFNEQWKALDITFIDD